ncbi:MAG: HAMP domain-containing sensor histidine kinase [Rhodospirillales bacterium]
MSELAAVKSLRYRYVLGLAAIALLVTASFVTMHFIIDKQSDYAHLIFVAGGQNGQTNRIAHFAGQMALAQDEYEYEISRAQLGRAVNAMQRAHLLLLTGDAEAGIPQVMTKDLEIIYFDNTVGLDLAVNRFLDHARDIYTHRYGELRFNTSSYVYLINYGPHVLEPMLNSAVEAYEAFSRSAIGRIKRFETGLWICALLALLGEALFIYRPLESKVRATVQELETKNTELRRTIMDIAQAQDDMERQKNRAERANRAKTEFLSNMSHELRTPLNAIIGFSGSLKEGVYGPLANGRQEECLRDINSSGSHLLSLINDILDLSAAEAQQLHLSEAEINLDRAIGEAFRMVGGDVARKGIHLGANIAPGLPGLFADERRIKQILLNLLSNAVKFTGTGGRVTVEALLLDGGGLRLAVVDTGIGMDAEELEIALSRFGQVGHTMTRDHQGTGLGLPLAIELAKTHGATTEVVSAKGKGTRVVVDFPPSRVAARLASRHRSLPRLTVA